MKKLKKNSLYGEEKLDKIKNEEIIEVEDTQIKELMEEEIELQKKENEEKQEEVEILENSEEIYGIVEG